jgi:hypothetical protein
MVRKFSEVYPTFGGDQKYLRVEDLEGKTFVVSAFRVLETQWGPAVVVEVDLGGKQDHFITWSKVILDQLSSVADALPLEARLEKRGRYYRLA